MRARRARLGGCRLGAERGLKLDRALAHLVFQMVRGVSERLCRGLKRITLDLNLATLLMKVVEDSFSGVRPGPLTARGRGQPS